MDVNEDKNAIEKLTHLSAFLRKLSIQTELKEASQHKQGLIIYFVEIMYAFKYLLENQAEDPAKLESNSILSCSINTDWTAIRAFCYRLIYENQMKKYCIIEPEKLSNSNQEKFVELLKKLLENKENEEKINRFFLIVITKKKKPTLLVEYVLNNLDMKKSFGLKKISPLKEFKNNFVVTSEISG